MNEEFEERRTENAADGKSSSSLYYDQPEPWHSTPAMSKNELETSRPMRYHKSYLHRYVKNSQLPEFVTTDK